MRRRPNSPKIPSTSPSTPTSYSASTSEISDKQHDLVRKLLKRFTDNPKRTKDSKEVQSLMKNLESEFFGGQTMKAEMVNTLVKRFKDDETLLGNEKEMKKALAMLESKFGGRKAVQNEMGKQAKKTKGGIGKK